MSDLKPEQLTVSNWRDEFDDRQKDEIRWAETYLRDFHHGALGHNVMLVVAKMAALLDATLPKSSE